jgi:hypothetical protein
MAVFGLDGKELALFYGLTHFWLEPRMNDEPWRPSRKGIWSC